MQSLVFGGGEGYRAFLPICFTFAVHGLSLLMPPCLHLGLTAVRFFVVTDFVLSPFLREPAVWLSCFCSYGFCSGPSCPPQGASVLLQVY